MSDMEESIGDVSHQVISDTRNNQLSLDQSIINTESEERTKEHKPLTGKKKKKKGKKKKKKEEEQPVQPSRHKRWIFFIMIITAVVIYYFVQKQLTPQQELIQTTWIQQGKIEFDIGISQKVSFIKQKVDHFDEQDDRFFAQRLILNVDLSTITESTPIFLNLPPLATAKVPQSIQSLKAICITMNCVEISLQPRYFGQSIPLSTKQYRKEQFEKKSDGDKSFVSEQDFQVDLQSPFMVDNLEYLTISQMVEDIAFAIDRIRSLEFFGIKKSNPWIINGESYSGMIAVWFRAKYPEMTVGAYASSPLMPTNTAPQLSERVYTNTISGGKTCRTVIRSLLKDLREKVYGEKKEGFLLDMGLGVHLTSEDALYLFMDRIRIINRAELIKVCSKSDEKDLFTFMEQLFTTQVIGDKDDPLAYSVKELSSKLQWQYFPIVRNRRAFEWLRCKEIGLFEVDPNTTKHHFNFEQLNQTYFRNRCDKIFLKGLWPNATKTKNIFADKLSIASNIFVANGYYDIWLPYTYQPRNTTSVTNSVVKCSFCVHNFDAFAGFQVYSTVEELRRNQEKTIRNWIQRKDQ